ncbi:MAG TPA: thiamine pyrophosphate-dependent enzyme, partial [Solirubrobacteraceae bacterium]|nr:thiamine pyrophosphate-dependent enzyme [Solirubrobacteraceae bacterium]
VLVLGSRLDFGTIGADVAAFARDRTIVQVDCDAGEMHRVRAVTPVVADLGTFLPVAADRARERAWPAWGDWRAHLEELRERWPDTEELEPCEGINPNRLLRQLAAASPEAAAFVIDAGQHLWWACQSIQPGPGQRFMPALGLGPCGFALPAAVGVAVASRRPLVVVAGDGAFQLNIQELQTVVRNRLPMKIVIVDNGCHGSVRQLQESAFAERYPTTVWGYDAPDFERVAAAYGIDSATIEGPGEVEQALEWLWRDPLAPALLQVRIPLELNVYPNVPFGAPLTMMERKA